MEERQTKNCSKCKFPRDIDEFQDRKGTPDGKGYVCGVCRRQSYKAYRSSHKEQYARHAADFRSKNVEELKGYRRKVNSELKVGAFTAYGGRCSCCGESEPAFLTIDHVDGNGNKHRHEVGRRGGSDFYRWLKQKHYPGGFQVMCFNCNFAKHLLGRCPHQALRTPEGRTTPERMPP